MGQGAPRRPRALRGGGPPGQAAQRASAPARWPTSSSATKPSGCVGGLLDFDDLIIACADALAGDAAFADAVRWRTRHLFVDEMQDVNPAQFRLLTALLSDEPDLFVVGDPNQSVYGFNGADPSLLVPPPRDPAGEPR